MDICETVPSLKFFLIEYSKICYNHINMKGILTARPKILFVITVWIYLKSLEPEIFCGSKKLTLFYDAFSSVYAENICKIVSTINDKHMSHVVHKKIIYINNS